MRNVHLQRHKTMLLYWWHNLSPGQMRLLHFYKPTMSTWNTNTPHWHNNPRRTNFPTAIRPSHQRKTRTTNNVTAHIHTITIYQQKQILDQAIRNLDGLATPKLKAKRKRPEPTPSPQPQKRQHFEQSSGSELEFEDTTQIQPEPWTRPTRTIPDVPVNAAKKGRGTCGFCNYKLGNNPTIACTNSSNTCGQTFHLSCTGYSPAEANNLLKWFCNQCDGSHNGRNDEFKSQGIHHPNPVTNWTNTPTELNWPNLHTCSICDLVVHQNEQHTPCKHHCGRALHVGECTQVWASSTNNDPATMIASNAHVRARYAANQTYNSNLPTAHIAMPTSITTAHKPMQRHYNYRLPCAQRASMAHK